MRILAWSMTAALAAAAIAFPVAQARTLSEILSAGELRVGVNPNYPPAAQYDDKNELAGFDVDISRQLAQLLGVKLSLVVVDPASRVPFLATNKVDTVMAGMTRTAERAKVIDFTVPVNTEAFGLVATKASSFHAIADMNLDTVTFAEVRGTTPVTYIEANLPKAKLLLLASWPDAYRAVRDGRATAVVEEGASMVMEMKRLPDVPWAVIPGAFGPVNYDCIGTAKGNATLTQWLNVALFKLASDGVVDETWRKWYGADMVVKIVQQPYF